MKNSDGLLNVTAKKKKKTFLYFSLRVLWLLLFFSGLSIVN